MRGLALGIVMAVTGCGIAGCGEGAAATTAASPTASGETTSTSGTGGSGGEITTTAASGGSTSTSATGGSGGSRPTTGSGGSGAAGGSGGATSGSGGTTSATTTTTTGAGGNMPMPCVWGDDCGQGFYCLAPGCGAGTCSPQPGPAGLSPDATPVCGCDGVTYWNEEVAASKGASIEMMGACTMPVVCGPQTPCPGSMKCNREVADGNACSPDAGGECWGTALSCPLDGPKGRACTTATCELTCSLIQSQNAWFEDPSCN